MALAVGQMFKLETDGKTYVVIDMGGASGIGANLPEYLDVISFVEVKKSATLAQADQGWLEDNVSDIRPIPEP